MGSQQTKHLRNRAEELLGRVSKALPPFADPAELIHELQVHQVELEMQNEQLTTTELELSTARERYRDLFEFAPVGYVVYGPNGIVAANQTLAKMLAAAPGALDGLPLRRFVVPGDVGAFLEHERAVLQSGEHQSVELRISALDGELREIRLESKRTSGVAKMWRSAVIDVTEERRLERQLLAAALDEQHGPVARGMVHDFGHVLMSVIAQADRALARLPESESARVPLLELKKVALDGALTAAQLLEARRDAGAPSTFPDLDLQLRDMDTVLRRLCGTDVRLRIDANAKGAGVPISPAQIEQVVINLVTNACDAMPAGGDLLVETLLPPGSAQVELRVTDSGAGMEAESRARMLEPAFTTKAESGGSGLGLATVYGVVKRAGGQLHLRSTPGQGTSVQILLPRIEPQAAPQAAPAVEVRRVRILVVEDDAPVRRVAKRELESAGYGVIEAATAEEALELLRADPDVQMMLCDVGLPAMAGPDLVRNARLLIPGLRATLMSGLGSEDVDLPEMTHFLAKPFDTHGLLQQVHATLVESDGAFPTVLVVEDDSMVLLVYQELLWAEGFHMLAAKNVAQATQIFQRNPSHVAAVLTDFNLPDGNGADLASELRRLRPELPVVFVSAQRQDDPRLVTARDLPHTESVSKPVEIAALATTLRRMLVSD